MKKIFLTIILTLFFISNNSYAQAKFIPESNLGLLFDRNSGNTIYQQFSNPAHLFEDWHEEILYIRSEASGEDGDFKPFVQPGRLMFLSQSVSGKKQIDSLQIFRGSFQVQKQIRADWDWFATRDMLFGMPFLLGDSSRGDTRFNGIAMSAEYCRKINKFHLGASLDYYVDEGLKKVSPKPTSKHRDIIFRAGVEYQPAKRWQLSALFSVADNQEEIYYREDQSSYYQETTLFKFRGYDFPLVFNKKTETRYGYFNEYGVVGAAKYSTENGSSLTTFFEQRLQQNDIKDNSVNPQNQGYWQNVIYAGGIRGGIRFHRLVLASAYRYRTESSWAKHPDFRTLLTETRVPGHKLSIAGRYQLNAKASAGIEIEGNFRDIDYRDYYSAVDWAVKQMNWQEKAGVQIQWRPALFTFLSVSTFQGLVSDKFLSVQSPSDFWKWRQADVEYFFTDHRGYRLDFEMMFYWKYLGFVQWHFGWQQIFSDHKSYFQGDSRSYLTTGLTLQLKAY
ncbi:MAG: hypothetical protein GXO74_06455 [Calditrichaeota bacterium]|nr:hypothetical protein [Calditrichota bacterium]